MHILGGEKGACNLTKPKEQFCFLVFMWSRSGLPILATLCLRGKVLHVGLRGILRAQLLQPPELAQLLSAIAVRPGAPDGVGRK